MTRSEQERLVERYLSGEMISADEEEFFMQVAVNQDLRQTLKAYRIVESAIRKHRDNAPAHHDQSRTRFIAMLSAHAAAHPTAAHLEAAHPTASRQSAIRSAGTRLGRRITVSTAALQWFVGSVAVFAFTLGTFIVAPLINDTPDEPPQPAQPAAQPGPGPQMRSYNLAEELSASIGISPARTSPPSGTAPADVAAPATTTVPTPPAHAARRSAHGSPELLPASRAKKTRPSVAESDRPSVAASPASAQVETPAKRTRTPRVVVRDNSLKVRVRVDRPTSQPK
jgi:hypothetical protein